MMVMAAGPHIGMDAGEFARYAEAWLTRDVPPGQFWPEEPEVIDESQTVICDGCGRETPLHDMGLIPAGQPSTLCGELRCIECWAQSRVRT